MAMRCLIACWAAVAALTAHAAVREDTVIVQGNTSGRQSVETLADGAVRAQRTKCSSANKVKNRGQSAL